MCSLEVKNVLFRTFALPCTPVSYGLDTLPAVYSLKWCSLINSNWCVSLHIS